MWVIMLSGFFWGKLILVLSALLLLVLGAPINQLSILILLVSMILIMVGMNVAIKSLKLSPGQYILLGSMGAVIFAAAYLLTDPYYVVAGADSFFIILLSKMLEQYGAHPYAVNYFTDWGVISTVFQTFSSAFNLDYLSGYQTIITGLLFGLLVLSMINAFTESFSVPLAIVLGGLTIPILLSIMIIEHAFFLHTNITAAAFIFVFLLSIWHFYQESAVEWLILGSISLIGIGFSRIEGPMYAVLFASLAVSIKKTPLKQILYLILPYAILGLAWHAYLYFYIGQTGILNEINIVIIILLSLAGLIGYAVLSAAVKKADPLQYIVPAILLVGVLIAFITKPEHMAESLYSIGWNLLYLDAWGLTWVLLLLFLPLIFNFPRPDSGNRFLFFSIAGYFLLVFLFAYLRPPYRLGSSDSANRLIMQILPAILFSISANSKNIKNWFLKNN